MYESKVLIWAPSSLAPFPRYRKVFLSLFLMSVNFVETFKEKPKSYLFRTHLNSDGVFLNPFISIYPRNLIIFTYILSLSSKKKKKVFVKHTDLKNCYI